ncbi:protein rep [Aquiluna sp. KACHI24]|uniref:protein rep n=1 Tax=Aquiluna sp. KACHI24 TaxID=2968831 RepID=UPI002203BDA5|nr:protein rep [Aquiluna sp. KACHI24]BDQ00737.1 hypothetical protein AKACHI_10730 [Aquiluna sp. KACHI24]
MITYEFRKSNRSLLAAYAVRLLLEHLREITQFHSVGNCFPYGPKTPKPKLAEEWLAKTPGLTGRCGHRNACPVCARVHEAKMRKRFAYAFDQYIAGSCTPWWQTLEAGFDVSLEARQRYEVLNRLWVRVLNSRRIKRARAALGVAYMRVTEETLINGVWTPHFHALWMFPRHVSEVEVVAFIGEFNSKWRNLQSKTLGLLPSIRLLHSDSLDSNTVPIMQYLFKSFRVEIDEEGQFSKQGMKTPLDYLISAVMSGDAYHLEIWQAYEIASSGIRRYIFSRNWLDAY